METDRADSGVAHGVATPQRGFFVLLIAGLLAAYGGWRYVDRYFLYADALPRDIMSVLEAAQQPGRRTGRPTRAEVQTALSTAETLYWQSQVRHSAWAFGVFGGLMGITLTLAEFLGRRSVKFLIVATVGAALLGAGFGALGGVAARFALNQLFFKSGYKPMVVTMLTHMLGWSGLAVGVGLSYRWFHGGARETFRNTVACVMGAVAAALLFTPLCAYLMPMGSTVPLVPEESYPRLLWMALAGAAIATFPAIVAIRQPVPAVAVADP